MLLEEMVRILDLSGYYKKCNNSVHGIDFVVCVTRDNKSYVELYYSENENGEDIVTDVSFIYKECKL